MKSASTPLASSTGGIFCNLSIEGVVTFTIKPLILMILVREDRFEAPLSIDTNKVPAVHLTSQ